MAITANFVKCLWWYSLIIITNLYMMFNVSKSVTVTLPSTNIKLAVAQIIIFRLSYSMVRIADVLC